jgi:hypothetical protein
MATSKFGDRSQLCVAEQCMVVEQVAGGLGWLEQLLMHTREAKANSSQQDASLPGRQGFNAALDAGRDGELKLKQDAFSIVRTK